MGKMKELMMTATWQAGNNLGWDSLYGLLVDEGIMGYDLLAYAEKCLASEWDEDSFRRVYRGELLRDVVDHTDGEQCLHDFIQDVKRASWEKALPVCKLYWVNSDGFNRERTQQVRCVGDVIEMFQSLYMEREEHPHHLQLFQYGRCMGDMKIMIDGDELYSPNATERTYHTEYIYRTWVGDERIGGTWYGTNDMTKAVWRLFKNSIDIPYNVDRYTDFVERDFTVRWNL